MPAIRHSLNLGRSDWAYQNGLLCSGSPGAGGHAEVDGAVGAAADLGELVFGAGEADLEAFDFAEPSLTFGLGDAGDQVVADLGDAGTLGGVWPVQGAAQAAVLVDARGAERSAAYSGGDLAAFEVAEEFLPFGVGGGAVFLSGPQRPAAGEEGQVGLDGLVGVGGFVAEGHVDVAVPGDHLGDVRWEPVQDGVGEEHPAEIVRGVVQWLAAGAGQAGAGGGGGEHFADGGGGDRAVL